MDELMRLDTYTYAVNKTAHLRTGSSRREWIGPCIVPGCSSRHDAFSVQPEGKRTGQWAGYGAWMCRKCWDPSEMVMVKGIPRKRGWGNIVELVKACEGLDYKGAKRFVLEYEGVIIPMDERPVLAPPKSDEVWFRETIEYVSNAQKARPEDIQRFHSYLASRGLTVETAKRLALGYSLDPIKIDDEWRKIPFLVIPWYRADGTLYRKVNRRNLHSPLPDDESKYYPKAGSNHDALYLGECLLTSKRPVFLCESELDAATVLQEAGDLVNVVATGTTQGSRNAVNEGRLRRQPFVFLAFDTDASGEDAANYWKAQLDKCIRYRPLAHDINEMHTSGLSIRQWVEVGIARYVPIPSELPEVGNSDTRGEAHHITDGNMMPVHSEYDFVDANKVTPPAPADPLADEQPIEVNNPQPVICHALAWLNKEGGPCGAREKPHTIIECGNTTWVWSSLDQVRICGTCHTPLPGEEPHPVGQVPHASSVSFWTALQAKLAVKGYYEEVARDNERLLNLSVPPRRYPAPFPAYGRRKDGTFGQIGWHGCNPGEYWTLDEWEAMQQEEKVSA